MHSIQRSHTRALSFHPIILHLCVKPNGFHLLLLMHNAQILLSSMLAANTPAICRSLNDLIERAIVVSSAWRLLLAVRFHVDQDW